LKRARFAGGHDGRTLKQILQIVIAVAVKSANGVLFFRSLELSVDPTVIGAALGLDAKSAETPQLPLGVKPVWGLQYAKQYGCPDRTDRRNLAEPFPGLVFLGLPARSVISAFEGRNGDSSKGNC
jgi:hypothetical protein